MSSVDDPRPGTIADALNRIVWERINTDTGYHASSVALRNALQLAHHERMTAPEAVQCILGHLANAMDATEDQLRVQIGNRPSP